MINLTQDYLKEVLDYNLSTGIFRWKVDRGYKIKAGQVAGFNSQGYIRIGINNKRYLSHRLIWLYTYGYLPEQIDHINRVRDDNRIENLREATQIQNRFNSSSLRNSSSIYKGVSWVKRDKKWLAQIKYESKTRFIGYFKDEKKAALAYNEKAKELFGNFAFLNEV